MTKTIVNMKGTIRVTIEEIANNDGTTTYRARGRRLAKMVYTRDFDTSKKLYAFVNRSAGQSLRQERVRAFTAGYIAGANDALEISKEAASKEAV